jgi:hypothetical protein
MSPASKGATPMADPDAPPVGAQTDVAQLNAMLTSDAQAMAAVMGTQLRRWRWVSKIGAAGLEAPPYNMDPARAAEMFAGFNYLATLALVYYGQATQDEEFDDRLAGIRGPS